MARLSTFLAFLIIFTGKLAQSAELPANPWASPETMQAVREYSEEAGYNDNFEDNYHPKRSRSSTNHEVEWAKQKAAAVRLNNARIREEVRLRREAEIKHRRELARRQAEEQKKREEKSFTDSIKNTLGSLGDNENPAPETSNTEKSSFDDTLDDINKYVDKTNNKIKNNPYMQKMKRLLNF